MIVRLARHQDVPGLVDLAAQVEQWFGPMAEDRGFRSALERNIDRGTLLVAESESAVVGGLIFGATAPTFHIHWLVVSEQQRGTGVGRMLMAEATRKFVVGPGTIEVVTFGADHPGAVASGARIFYERLGFTPGESAGRGPEGGSRQVYRLTVA
ncbi:MAG TPA: GNAT family N-acetyltransferase [Micromonosporaceae bacterium]